MSAPQYLPQRHLNLLTDSSLKASQEFVRPCIADRFLILLDDIEAFLFDCTYEEMCNFWNAITNLRVNLKKRLDQSAVPHFLTGRRKNRDFARILEVLADLSYPKLHLSSKIAERLSDRIQAEMHSNQSATDHPHFAAQR